MRSLRTLLETTVEQLEMITNHVELYVLRLINYLNMVITQASDYPLI